MLGVMPTRDAQRLADQRGLDLVEITPNAQPPVCKIMDYGKFKYEESIREKQARKAQKVQKVKETMLKTYDEQVKTNGFWMNYIDEYVWTGKNLVKGQREAIESLTPEKIAAFLKQLVASGNHVEVIMLPEEEKK